MNYKDSLKQNVIFYIARDGKFKLLDYLLTQGVKFNEIDSYGQNPLYYAAREGKADMAAKLIDLGIDIDHIDQYSQTCLFYAAKKGSLETCKCLIERGAKHDYVDPKKQTPAAYAKKSGNKELIEYFQSLKQKDPKKVIAAPEKIALSVGSANEEKNLGKRKREKEEPKITYKLVLADDSGNVTELTEKDFEKFRNDYPDVANLMLNPEKALSIHEGEVKEKDSWDKIAKKIMNILWKMKGAFHFHIPVDPLKWNCPDYFNIVKNPMDFGTVKVTLFSQLK